MNPCIDLSTFIGLLGLTVGLGVLISLGIVAMFKRRWDEKDARRAIDELRRTSNSRYTA